MENYPGWPDGGPTPEYCRELRESEGAAWPRPVAMTRAEHGALRGQLARIEADRAAVIRTLAERGAYGPQACPSCGGPRICPDLESTLAYRRCGYAEVPGVGWIHQ